MTTAPQTDRLIWLTAFIALAGVGCRGTQRCALDERFDDRGECVAVSTCPSGRDPSTGECTDEGTRDSGTKVDGGERADGGTTTVDGGSIDGGLCAEDCGSRYCHPDEMMCVDCIEHPHCPGETPECDSNGWNCQGCTSNDSCIERGGPEICNLTTGRCVDCTTDTERSACSDMVCDPVNGTCTDRPIGALETCQECMYDSDCGESSFFSNAIERCVDFDGRSYCLVDRDSGTLGGSCPPGVPVELSATSVGGETAIYCAPDATVTTCEAAHDDMFMQNCTTDAVCGLNSGNPTGRCLTTSTVCTSSCNEDSDCFHSRTCNLGLSPGRCE